MLISTGAVPDLVLVDPASLLPRYWATAWSLDNKVISLAANTRKVLLRHVGAFYQYCDKRFGMGSLDAAIGSRSVNGFQAMVEGFYIELTSNPGYTTTTVQRWDAVRKFALSVARRLAPACSAWRSLSILIEGMAALRPPNHGQFRFVRSLPLITLQDLLIIAEPNNPRNPFLDYHIQLRNWLIVNLLLLCGLRRSETLVLSTDALKHDVDPETGDLLYWIDVTTGDSRDGRTTRPSIKTHQSHRQIPVSEDLAEVYMNYLSDVRVSSNKHNFLLTTRRGEPLSAESVNRMMRRLTAALSTRALQRFRERTGGKISVSPHDLRHTCATARFSMFMKVDHNRELTLQRMRAFFGWSLTSEMPEHYARSAIQDDLLRLWMNHFDSRLRLVNSLED